MMNDHLRAAPGSKYVGIEQVPVTTIKTVHESTRFIPESTLLKIDTQGFETEVLDGCGDLEARFRAIQLELSLVPLYEGQTLLEPLKARLEGHGLELYSLEPGISDSHGRLLQCDALFVRLEG
jgi:hypothetical protein